MEPFHCWGGPGILFHGFLADAGETLGLRDAGLAIKVQMEVPEIQVSRCRVAGLKYRDQHPEQQM